MTIKACCVAISIIIVVSSCTGESWARMAYKKSLDVLYTNRAIVEIYFRDKGKYPSPGTTLKLSLLKPMLGKHGDSLKVNDGWGNEFVYIGSSDGRHAWLISPGINGEVEFTIGHPLDRQPDVGADIVVSDGKFVQVWAGWTQCPEGIKSVPDSYLQCEASGFESCSSEMPKLCSEYND